MGGAAVTRIHDRNTAILQRCDADASICLNLQGIETLKAPCAEHNGSAIGRNGIRQYVEPSTGYFHSRAVSVSATYNHCSSGDRPIPFGVCSGQTSSLMRLLSGSAAGPSGNTRSSHYCNMQDAGQTRAPSCLGVDKFKDASHVESEMHDIAVMHHILLALDAQLAGILSAVFALERHKILV